MEIREATAADWPEIWPIVRDIVSAGDTYTWDPATTEAQARAKWMSGPPARTYVAVDAGEIVGTAEVHPNQGGAGSHVANAGFMVPARHAGRGVARALCRYVVDAARAGGFRAMQFNAVVETNTRAVALWQSEGFAILATVPEAFRHPVHGYVGLHIMHRML